MLSLSSLESTFEFLVTWRELSGDNFLTIKTLNHKDKKFIYPCSFN